MTQNYADTRILVEALQWHLDNGADDMLLDAPVDRTAMPEIPSKQGMPMEAGLSMATQAKIAAGVKVSASKSNVVGFQDNSAQAAVDGTEAAAGEMMGAAQAIVEAQKLASAAENLEQLQQAIRDFEGLSIRKTATNMVFADGNPKAEIMLIGEIPGAAEDIEGKPFVGIGGQLQDRILASIGLGRAEEDLSKAVYMTNILNWRPPGNRTPSQAEIDISLPFLERHIALIQPQMLIICGGTVAKALLRSADSISKLRGCFHDYQVPETLKSGGTAQISAVVTYSPEYLINTPAQKKAVWTDMLMLKEKLKDIT